MGSCIDLRKYQESGSIQDAFSKIVSGKYGYKAVIERKKEIPKCPHCQQNAQCPGCTFGLENDQKFCADCGHKLKGNPAQQAPIPTPATA